jgi:hypothetical protein
MIGEWGDFSAARVEEVSVGIVFCFWSFPVFDTRVHDPECLGADDPRLTFFQTIQQDGTH